MNSDTHVADSAAIERWMQHALELARRGQGCVEPNPMVGAVVLDATGACVGTGWHQRFGEAHAEVHALAEAGERAEGGTLIVTLEPCCHHGKTPPCTDAVLRSGVRRVIVAMPDPFPRVAGGGLAILRAAGLEVRVGIGRAAAEELNAPYLKRVQTGLPWVHLKWAMTLDGQIATVSGESRWISNEQSRARVHELRGRMDAIIVGGGTVRMDDPLLTARPPGPRTATRVVVTTTGALPPACQLTRTARDGPVLVATTPEGRSRLATWEAAGCEIRAWEHLQLRTVLAELGQRGMTNVLIEGGAGLLGSCVDEGIGDELHVFVAPLLVGGGQHSPMAGHGLAKLADAWRFDPLTVHRLGTDTYLHARRTSTPILSQDRLAHNEPPSEASAPNASAPDRPAPGEPAPDRPEQ